MTVFLGWPDRHSSVGARIAHLSIATRLLGDSLARPLRPIADFLARQIARQEPTRRD